MPRGLGSTGLHAFDNRTAGLTAQNVGKLRLKWALGFAGAVRVRSQPALAGGAIFIGSEDGRVYALDRETGCARWQFQGAAEVRTGIIVAPWKAGDQAAKPLLYFADIVGNVYAVDANSGVLVWRDRTDPHPSTTITGSPVLYDGRFSGRIPGNLLMVFGISP